MSARWWESEEEEEIIRRASFLGQVLGQTASSAEGKTALECRGDAQNRVLVWLTWEEWVRVCEWKWNARNWFFGTATAAAKCDAMR